MPGNKVSVIIQGLACIKVRNWVHTSPHLRAEVEVFEEPAEQDTDLGTEDGQYARLGPANHRFVSTNPVGGQLSGQKHRQSGRSGRHCGEQSHDWSGRKAGSCSTPLIPVNGWTRW